MSVLNFIYVGNLQSTSYILDECLELNRKTILQICTACMLALKARGACRAGTKLRMVLQRVLFYVCIYLSKYPANMNGHYILMEELAKL